MDLNEEKKTSLSEEVEEPQETQMLLQTMDGAIDYENTKPRLLSTTDFGDFFTKGCKWSPDGLCILVCSDDHYLRIFDLPPEDKLNQREKLDKLDKAAVEMKEGENVYDYQWFPMMNSGSPET